MVIVDFRSGCTSDQHQRAGHQPAAEHAVELADPVVRRSTSVPRPPSGTGLRARPEAREAAPPPRADEAGARFSSAIVFHSPQPGQRPCHFGLSCPQEVQAKTVAERAFQRG